MEYSVSPAWKGSLRLRGLLKGRVWLLVTLISFVTFAILAATPVASGAGGGAEADISLTKTGDKSVPVGGQITYQVVVSNAGPDDATNVVVTDPIPAHTSFVNASVSQGTVMFDGTTVTANFGTIIPFESGSLSLTLSIDSDTPRDTSISNTATATTNTLDPDPDNNLATASTAVAGPFPGDVLISEFRFRGPTPSGSPATASADEFVEIYNNTDSNILVTDTLGSIDQAIMGPGVGGWALVSSDNPGTPKFVIPAGTTIPARGHFLAVNSNGYSLSGYPAGDPGTAVGDLSYTADIPDNAGIALFRTANASAFNAGNRFDAVGFSNVSDPVYREGNGLEMPVTSDVQHSQVRKLLSGLPQDTDNNFADFVLVATDGNLTLVLAQLGAPGPENLFSPIQRNALIKASLIEPSSSSSLPPNRVRTGSGNSGTLSLRRRFSNNTGAPLTRLRFRVVNISTLGTPIDIGSQADLRLVTSSDFDITTSLGDLTVLGTVLEQPPTQNLGGGLNSSASVTLPGGALVPGASIDVQFLLNVVTAGNFRFLVNVESLDDPGPPKEGKETVRRTQATRHRKARASGLK